MATGVPRRCPRRWQAKLGPCFFCFTCFDLWPFCAVTWKRRQICENWLLGNVAVTWPRTRTRSNLKGQKNGGLAEKVRWRFSHLCALLQWKPSLDVSSSYCPSPCKNWSFGSPSSWLKQQIHLKGIIIGNMRCSRGYVAIICPVGWLFHSTCNIWVQLPPPPARS